MNASLSSEAPWSYVNIALYVSLTNNKETVAQLPQQQLRFKTAGRKTQSIWDLAMLQWLATSTASLFRGFALKWEVTHMSFTEKCLFVGGWTHFF